MPATQASSSSLHIAPTHGLRLGEDGWLRSLEIAQPAPRPLSRRREPMREATPPRPVPLTWDRGFPKIELLRSPTHLLVRVALPGVAEEDLRIRFEESDLVIEGEMRPAGGEVGCHSVISEWSYGPFHRRVQLGVVVDPAAMRSELREGLLRIEVDLSENAEQATPDC